MTVVFFLLSCILTLETVILVLCLNKLRMHEERERQRRDEEASKAMGYAVRDWQTRAAEEINTMSRRHNRY